MILEEHQVHAEDQVLSSAFYKENNSGVMIKSRVNNSRVNNP